MKQLKVFFGSIYPIFLIPLLFGIPVEAAFAISKQVPVISTVKTRYPKACRELISPASGLCLLTSVKSRASNAWLLKTQDQGRKDTRFIDKAVTPNVFMKLAPANYILYSKDGLDSGGHELTFTVEMGTVKTIKTASIKASGKGYYIRHFKPAPGVNGEGCEIRQISRKLSDLLPGNYLVYKANPSEVSVRCPPGGVAMNALAGETKELTVRKNKAQILPAVNRYRHPDSVSSLTSISQFRDDIQEVGILNRWLSYNGIVNPFPHRYSALVMSGLGTRTYVIPFTPSKNKAVCGRSLAKAGLTALPLLTECKFVGGKLKDFRVQAGGSYFALNTRYGVPTIEGNNINNSIKVKGLAAAVY